MLGCKAYYYLCILLSLLVQPAFATDLLDAYQLGAQNDPTYQAAVANYLSKKEASPQAWASVFPQVVANAGLSELRRQLLNGAGGRADLYSYNVGANLSQVVFDWAVFHRIRQASSVVKQATYTLAAAKQELMVRVARAYFGVLLAQDNLRFTKQQRDGALRQLNATRERYKVGHATITSLEQFQGQYESLRAQVDTDNIALSNSLEQLGEIIGRQFGPLTPVKSQFVLKKPNPAQLPPWLEKAQQMNLSLTAARYGFVAAKKNISVLQGGHLPTLKVVADYDRNKTPSVLTLVSTDTWDVGLKLNFPIFQGGAVNSQVRQARAQFQLAEAQMEQAYRETLSETTQAYHALVLGVSQLSADGQTVKYNKSALEHVEEGYASGVGTTLDVIQQQTRLLAAQRDYARDRYTYLTNVLLLEQAVGTLKPETLARLQVMAITN